MTTPRLPSEPSRSVIEATERRLVRMLRAGLADAGIVTGRRRHSLLYIDLDHPVGVNVYSYSAALDIWRITFGIRFPDPYPPLSDTHELTLHLSEFGRHTGSDLARLLRDPHLWRGPGAPVSPDLWRWPIFAHSPAYPTYAWTEQATDVIEADRRLREQIARQAKERRTAR